MWKLIVIHQDHYTIYEEPEKQCRDNLEKVVYRGMSLFAFLYNDKAELTETFINTIKR